MLRLLLVPALYGTIFLSAAQAATNSFFKHLSGNWSGAGQAYLPKVGEVSADCQTRITGDDTQIAMKGSCGFLVIRQPLEFTITNSDGNNYVGTYTGSRTGPAKLNGTLQGDQLILTITWGGLVNGDRTAQMVLQRTGPNTFALTVNDCVAGKNRSTSSFTFKRN